MPFKCIAILFMRAKGEGVAEMRVSGSGEEDMVGGEWGGG
jgi:hypothetical protein